MISGFYRYVDETCAFLACCLTSWPLKMGPIACPETSVCDYYCTLCKIPEERRSRCFCYFPCYGVSVVCEWWEDSRNYCNEYPGKCRLVGLLECQTKRAEAVEGEWRKAWDTLELDINSGRWIACGSVNGDKWFGKAATEMNAVIKKFVTGRQTDCCKV